MGSPRVDPAMLATIQRMVHQGKTLVEIGRAIGRTKERVRQLCLKYGIERERMYRRNPSRPRHPSEAKGVRHLVPIDPVKARAITEAKKAYWRARVA